jgi:bacterioferritin
MIMRGDPKLIAELNAALSAELTAIAQYMVQAEMCANWGYQQLSQRTRARAIHEMRHAEGLIERILFLDGVPGVDITLKPQIGASVPAQLETDLKDEYDAVRQYNASAKACEAAGDYGTREMFDSMIKDEEEHANWLEGQLNIIEQAGLQNYLAQQLEKK